MVIAIVVSVNRSTLRGRVHAATQPAESRPTSQPIGKTTQSNDNRYMGRTRFPSSLINVRLLSLKTSLLSKQVLQGDPVLDLGLAVLVLDLGLAVLVLHLGLAPFQSKKRV